MSRISLLVMFLLMVSATAFGQLGNATNVYVLPMGGALDQFLAQHLTEEGVLQVVTDPAKADVILTSAIGEDFELTLREITNPTLAEDAGKAGDEFARPRMRPLSRNRGTVFLVERSTGNVLWSDFEPPSSGEGRDMDRAARRIVDHLEDALDDAREED